MDAEIQCNRDEHAKTDQKQNNQIQSDHLLAQQLEKDTNQSNNACMDWDHLMALSLEQQDIIDAVVSSDDILDIESEWITKSESEIIALLQSGVDIDSLITPNSTLTKEYILALKQKIDLDQKSKAQAVNRSHRKSKKRKKKKHSSYHHDDVEHVQNMDAFVKKLTTFPKQKKNKKHNARNKANKQKAKKKKRKNRKKAPQNKSHKPKKQPSSRICICVVCTELFESKAALYKHLQRNPKHMVQNTSNWLKRRNIPTISNWIINHEYQGNAIIHDKRDIYMYYMKQDRYTMIKSYDSAGTENTYDNKFWLSADLSPFYNKKLNNSSFYLLVLAIDGDQDEVKICDRIQISGVEDDIQVHCTEMDIFLNKVINIDPAETLLIGTNHHLLFILAHSSLCVCASNESNDESAEREIQSATLEFMFVIYNLAMDQYEERRFILDINTDDISTTYGGDFHMGIIHLDSATCTFLIFGQNVMFQGIYNEQLSLDDDECLRFERVEHHVRFGDVIECGEVYWNFSYLKYGDFILVFGGEPAMFHPMDDIMIYDIHNKRWLKSDAKLPFPLSSNGNNVFVDSNNWVHYMGGQGSSCHYSLPMKQILLLQREVDCIIHYWRRDTMDIIHGWLYDFNLIIYKYCSS
eukprot:505072_1